MFDFIYSLLTTIGVIVIVYGGASGTYNFGILNDRRWKRWGIGILGSLKILNNVVMTILYGAAAFRVEVIQFSI